MTNIHAVDWDQLYHHLNQRGYAVVPSVLSHAECEHLRGLYHDDYLYRNTIDMKRYRFGEGEYKYFRYPLPPAIQVLREEFYKPLATLANQWMENLSLGIRYPDQHLELIEQCHRNNQHRPTPLMLQYKTGGFNTLHQDLYGNVYFPFQVVFMLTQPEHDYEGGEFVITEQIPRAQSSAKVLRPNQGDAIIVTTNFRPVKGTRGYYRATVKHGVSEVKHGERYTLGIIFHDAA
jgi:uncharacterized protein